MVRTRIKFCGITRVEDARDAVACGADAIGMVLRANTARRISDELAERIRESLPPFISAVGLFVDTPGDEIEKVAELLRLDYVQLHGNESPEQVAELNRVRVIKAVHTLKRGWIDALDKWASVSNLVALLLDSGGGTGKQNDFEAIARAKRAGAFDALPPVVVAGGLDPINVGDVVRSLRPFAVDVSSGIEESKGLKSLSKMKAFFTAVRDEDARHMTSPATSS